MNVVSAIQDYVLKMLSSTPGMKVLLLDKETMSMISLVFAQSQLLQKEVYLFEQLDIKERKAMSHLKAICLLRPTRQNIDQLCDELRSPKYGEYHLYFSNIINSDKIEQLAEADAREGIKEVHEFFADYSPINPFTLTLNLPTVVSPKQPNWEQTLIRTSEGIVSFVLSLRKQPRIRYSGKSEIVGQVIRELDRRFSSERKAGLFHFESKGEPPLMLILDRRDDPITPLLAQWNYAAMIHEFLEIKNNRVTYKKDPSEVKSGEPDTEEVVLTPSQDSFYNEKMWAGFGDLGDYIKSLVDEFAKERTKLNLAGSSVEDLRKVLSNLPDLKQKHATVTKHVALWSQINEHVKERDLMTIGKVEQDIACNEKHNEHVKLIREIIMKRGTGKVSDKLKLVMLYALRYETRGTEIDTFKTLLEEAGVPREHLDLIPAIVRYAGQAQRSGDLFGERKDSISKMAKGMRDVENLYQQHKPLIWDLLQTLVQKKTLDDRDFPVSKNSPDSMGGRTPSEVLIFIVGGITYEEIQAVNDFNNLRNGIKVVIGGTTIHNCNTYLESIADFASS